jgi:glycogen(starch) synthase
MREMKKTLEHVRVFYGTGGPGDIINAYKAEYLTFEEIKHTTDVSLAFSNLFIGACRKQGASVYAVSLNLRKDTLDDNDVHLEHRPMSSLCSRGGVFWHIGNILYQLSLLATALKIRADIVFIAEAGNYWVWSLARFAGISVVPMLHCALWPSGFRPRGFVASFLQGLNGWFWRRIAFASVVVSPECERQIEEVGKGKIHGPILVGLSLFKPVVFAYTAVPPANKQPFRIMFAGRIEVGKGIFDLLEIASILDSDCSGEFHFEVCGDGSAFKDLRAEIISRNLGNIISLLGRLDRKEMTEAYGRSHAVIVPTTSAFAEGMCQVAIESILSGRPLISSRLCHALDYIGDAVEEAEPNDVESYVRAIRRLAENEEHYEMKRASCERLSLPFFDYNRSWGKSVGDVLELFTDGIGGLPLKQ